MNACKHLLKNLIQSTLHTYTIKIFSGNSSLTCRCIHVLYEIMCTTHVFHPVHRPKFQILMPYVPDLKMISTCKKQEKFSHLTVGRHCRDCIA